MAFDGKPSDRMPSPEMCIFEQILLTIFGLLTFDLLTSESNQFISASNWT